MQIKIFKSATPKSIMDVRSGLNYYQKKDTEEVYKGSVMFTINEYGQSEDELRAYLPKATAKMVLNAIKTHMFPRMFPNGFRQYGGTASTKKARVFGINYDPNGKRYTFMIEEGQGQVMKTGAIKMTKKEKSVMTFVSYNDTLELAHEVLDFIGQAELVAMMNKKPLYTIMTYNQNKNNFQQQNQQPQNNF